MSLNIKKIYSELYKKHKNLKFNKLQNKKNIQEIIVNQLEKETLIFDNINSEIDRINAEIDSKINSKINTKTLNFFIYTNHIIFLLITINTNLQTKELNQLYKDKDILNNINPTIDDNKNKIIDLMGKFYYLLENIKKNNALNFSKIINKIKIMIGYTDKQLEDNELLKNYIEKNKTLLEYEEQEFITATSKTTKPSKPSKPSRRSITSKNKPRTKSRRPNIGTLKTDKSYFPTAKLLPAPGEIKL